MNRISNPVLGVLFLLGTAAYCQQVNIAVLQFDAANVSEEEARVLTDRFRAQLIKIGAYNVVERAAMEEILKEQGFQQTGCVSDECVVEVGKLVGVQQVVAGGIGKIGTIYTVSARIIDVETGSIMTQHTLDCPCPIETLLTESMAEVAVMLSGRPVAETRPAESVPSVGSLSLYSEYDSVGVTVDGQFRGYAPLTVEGLRTDEEYLVTAVKEGFREYRQSFSVYSGRSNDVDIVLQPKAGELRILPSRQGQRFDLMVGDSVYKHAGDKTLALAEGGYRVMIQEHGFYDIVDTVQILDSETQVIHAKNEPILVPVKFNLHPQSSVLWIDGNVVSKEVMADYELPYGIYSVRAKARSMNRRLLSSPSGIVNL